MQPAQIVIARVIQREMGVRVDKARGKRRIAKIDHLRAAWDRQIAANIDNLIALDDDNAVLHERFRFPIEHALGFERDHLIGCVSRNSKTQENYNNARRNSHRAGLGAIRQACKKGMPECE